MGLLAALLPRHALVFTTLALAVGAFEFLRSWSRAAAASRGSPD